ncbi:MAG: glycoside hydrolase family 16 protein [Muribaculaceae bacterium]|nr:glycoside hydrolase family 16 protein [Muribaculaceae bacterium]
MMRIPFKFALVFGLLPFTWIGLDAANPQWKLVWAEEFNGPELDTEVWSKCHRSTPDWCNTMSEDESLYELRDGKLILRGVVNPDTSTDPSPFLTGGVWTKGKKSFEPGRFEIRARLEGTKGAWPAIWLLPFDHQKYSWPEGGEIDIMERLNNNHVAYQTVHSPYTYTLGQTDSPQSSKTSPIDRDGFNVYGVDMYPDKIVFHINGVTTHVYPRIEELADKGQFPFYIPQYLLIDMQLGGQWVGEVDPADLPVEMEVDWVRHYVLE